MAADGEQERRFPADLAADLLRDLQRAEGRIAPFRVRTRAPHHPGNIACSGSPTRAPPHPRPLNDPHVF